MTKQEIKKFIEIYDWTGLAEAYRKSEVSLNAQEWKELFNHIAKQERERIKMLIVEEVNIARSEGEKTSRLTALFNKISCETIL